MRSSLFFALFALLFSGCGGDKKSDTAIVPLYADTDRRAVAAYWSAPGRYVVAPLPADQERANITVAGSIWVKAFLEYVADKKAKGEDASADEAWFNAKLALDKATIKGEAIDIKVPPMPAAIKDALADPPPFYERVKPVQYTVTFAKEDAPAPFVYTDAIPFLDRKAYFASYRSPNGVVRYGRKLSEITGEEKKRIDALFAKAGRDPFERNVLQAVSRFEGGFEAVNTYDTGWVSVGFIQFITALNGDGSLSGVLARHKTDDQADFEKTFRRFGIDVDTSGAKPILVAIDPTTGDEKRGEAAVRAVIDDKRLTAVFERAGGTDAFRLAQVHVARDQYWPGDDTFTVAILPATAPPATNAAPVTTPPAAPATLTFKVSDIIKSEAGMATLMDRKVNRGNIRPLGPAVEKLMREKKLTKIDEIATHERAIIEAMKYRGEFLADKTLTQPK